MKVQGKKNWVPNDIKTNTCMTQTNSNRQAKEWTPTDRPNQPTSTPTNKQAARWMDGWMDGWTDTGDVAFQLLVERTNERTNGDEPNGGFVFGEFCGWLGG